MFNDFDNTNLMPGVVRRASSRALRGLAAAALAVSLVATAACSSGAATGSATAEDVVPAMTVTVQIDSSSVESPVSYDAEVGLPEDATVLDALEVLAGEEGFSVNMTDSSFGSYVSGIDGLAEREHGDMSGWTYTVNDEMVSDAASDCMLADGDTVTWTYVTEW